MDQSLGCSDRFSPPKVDPVPVDQYGRAMQIIELAEWLEQKTRINQMTVVSSSASAPFPHEISALARQISGLFKLSAIPFLEQLLMKAIHLSNYLSYYNEKVPKAPAVPAFNPFTGAVAILLWIIGSAENDERPLLQLLFYLYLPDSSSSANNNSSLVEMPVELVNKLLQDILSIERFSLSTRMPTLFTTNHWPPVPSYTDAQRASKRARELCDRLVAFSKARVQCSLSAGDLAQFASARSTTSSTAGSAEHETVRSVPRFRLTSERSMVTSFHKSRPSSSALSQLQPQPQPTTALHRKAHGEPLLLPPLLNPDGEACRFTSDSSGDDFREVDLNSPEVVAERRAGHLLNFDAFLSFFTVLAHGEMWQLTVFQKQLRESTFGADSWKQVCDWVRKSYNDELSTVGPYVPIHDVVQGRCRLILAVEKLAIGLCEELTNWIGVFASKYSLLLQQQQQQKQRRRERSLTAPAEPAERLAMIGRSQNIVPNPLGESEGALPGPIVGNDSTRSRSRLAIVTDTETDYSTRSGESVTSSLTRSTDFTNFLPLDEDSSGSREMKKAPSESGESQSLVLSEDDADDASIPYSTHRTMPSQGGSPHLRIVVASSPGRSSPSGQLTGRSKGSVSTSSSQIMYNNQLYTITNVIDTTGGSSPVVLPSNFLECQRAQLKRLQQSQEPRLSRESLNEVSDHLQLYGDYFGGHKRQNSLMAMKRKLFKLLSFRTNSEESGSASTNRARRDSSDQAPFRMFSSQSSLSSDNDHHHQQQHRNASKAEEERSSQCVPLVGGACCTPCMTWPFHLK